eukprot:scaffold7161_cov133-Cylindrotheca_fusiformis.AAC.9
MTTDAEDDSASQQQNTTSLHHNLQHFGWSPIRIEIPSIDPPTHDSIVQLFDTSSKIDYKNHPRYTYRGIASESGGSKDSEPKQSLEVTLANVNNNNNNITSDSTPKRTLVDDWCCAMHSIAARVNQLLELPSSFLSDEDEEDSSSLDLMRVFYYQATETPQMGSSPHTDWGSWTIVWQDDIGGLETYCRYCHNWVPVPPSSPSTSTTTTTSVWKCIVHVGDMASLALQPTNHHQVPVSSQEDSYYYSWPSPKHRVVTSHQERASLVYFGYPNANTSIQQLKTTTQEEFKTTKRRSKPMPLSEYSLLQDQSTNATTTTITTSSSIQHTQEDVVLLAQKAYKTIEKMSIQQVVQEKWNQVQRSG